jgi:hypothetical protein
MAVRHIRDIASAILSWREIELVCGGEAIEPVTDGDEFIFPIAAWDLVASWSGAVERAADVRGKFAGNGEVDCGSGVPEGVELVVLVKGR